MKQLFIALCLVLFISPRLLAQTESIKGKVVEARPDDSQSPLTGTNIYWAGTTVGTATDENGEFKIARVDETSLLVISYLGFENDTVDMDGRNYVQIELKPNLNLDEVEVSERLKSTQISFVEPRKTELISEKELTKAACCNLSESFETSPSVDVSFTDAVTGTRQIQMLGLAGPYSQITRENMPYVRGFNNMYGLQLVPGTWVQGIQLNKGTGSVVNGYESIAGQINYELQKPEDSERLFVNLYGNQGGRLEANVHLAHRFKNSRWSTGGLFHAAQNSTRWDRNNDNFLDMPLHEHYFALNRWRYIDTNGLRMQFGIKGSSISKQSGEMDFRAGSDASNPNIWGMNIDLRRLDGWAKIGRVFENMPWKSMGLQMSGNLHEQTSYYGLRDYNASQRSLYGNYIYQSILGNTNHKFKTGASFQYDAFQEEFADTAFDYNEVVPGAYFEYTYNYLDQFSAVAGLRGDYHNLFGFFATPRLHLRWAPNEKNVFRASAGRGQRTAAIFADNNGLMASNREFVIQGNGNATPYGLDAEVAWNYGLNYTRNFTINDYDGFITFDFYRTDFINQIVIDREQSTNQVYFYNLQGQSYSNSFQAQIDYEWFRGFSSRIAYRWFDVKTTYKVELMQRPLVSANRAFLNLAYETENGWAFDYTLNWQGEKRIPFTGDNPAAYQLPSQSPDFFLMNAQISKSWNDRFDLYLGGENLTNFRQANPILSSQNPFQQEFDASLVWGPIFGRMIYAGIRYRLP